MGDMDAEYQLDYFHQNGFKRRICPSCGSAYWTQGDASTCGDTPCVEYGFIGRPLTSKRYELVEMREAFLDFFANRGHARLERYPVIARWRKDIYLTIASIADFQPHCTSGEVPPPANPLAISQPCIRLNDLDSVGKSGRHLSCFEMMGHHAFNSERLGEIYWKEKTVEYCHEFMTDTLGMRPEDLTYKENPWSGGGNAGPALEVMNAGLEVATLVFMCYIADDDGDITIKGERYRPMDIRIVDTGYGLERLVWASDGSPTLYDSIFPDITGRVFAATGLDKVLASEENRRILEEHVKLCGILDVSTESKLAHLRGELAQKLATKGIDITPDRLQTLLEPIENAYTLIDHCRALTFMFADGVVPSNVKAGYLARLILRRCLRIIEEDSVPFTLQDIVGMHIGQLKEYPDLGRARDRIMHILELETGRYAETLEKGTSLVVRHVQGLARSAGGKGAEEGAAAGGGTGAEIGAEDLINFYDSHGLHPSVVKRIVEGKMGGEGVSVNVPDNFFSMVAERHGREKKEKEEKAVTYDVEPTRRLYYEDEHLREFDATVLVVDGPRVVLDATAFYPEGGGQPADHGTLMLPEGDAHVHVVDAQKAGDVIVHVTDFDPAPFRAGDRVRGVLDWDRRIAHMRHHTATHIMLAAARHVLGDHVWQAGASKTVDRARLDIAHYERITPEQVAAIERRANEIVLGDTRLDSKWHKRDEAERLHGQQLYQGGVPAGEDVRVVQIPGVDVEACAGTHTASTMEVGSIKIIHTERLQDGVERLEYAAGLAAVEANQGRDRLVRDAADALSVMPDQLPKTAARFFDEWKSLRKKVEELEGKMAGDVVGNLVATAEAMKVSTGGVRVVSHVADLDMKGLQALSKELCAQDNIVAILGGRGDKASFIVARSPDVDVNCGQAVMLACETAGGKGGGRPDFAQGAGPDASKVEEGVEKARLWVVGELTG